MWKRLVGLLCLIALTINCFISSPKVAASAESPARKSLEAPSQLAVAVTNELRIDRLNETVALDWKALTVRLPGLQPDHVLVKDHSSGQPVVSQTVDHNGDGQVDELIFQTDFTPREPSPKVFFISATKERRAAPESKVFARHVPERADDFAWENDRVAFRMYGKALEPTLVSSGIDVWTKRTRQLIINKWFKLGEEAYHKDTGEGLDMYSVKLSRGCGGSGLWDGQRLHVSRNYKSWKVIANGPIRTIFELTYEPWDVNGVAVSEVKRITLDAGQNLNRMESTLQFNAPLNSINLALGIAQHKEWKGATEFSKENGWLSLWENTGSNGNLGCAVAVDPKQIVGRADEAVGGLASQDINHLVMTPVQSGTPVRYYAGAGWDKSGDFAHQEAWHAYLNNFTQRLQSPLKISLLTKAPKENRTRLSWSKQVADSVLATYPNPKDLNLRGWDYHNGFFLSALMALWQRDKDPKYLQYIKDWVNLYVNDQDIIVEKTFGRNEHHLDDILPGRLLVALYQITKDQKYQKAAATLSAYLKTQPRTKDGGYWHKQVYPHQMWLDGIYMAGTYAVEYAQAFNEPSFFDDAAHQMTLIHQHTHDPQTGLLYHGWDESKTMVWADPARGHSPEFWGRAIGWYMMALVDTLDYLPKNHPKRNEIISILKKLSASLAKYQDAQTGLWYQVIDQGARADNWQETSATAMFVYALAKGVRQGHLDRQYTAIAKKAYQGLLDQHVYLDDSGQVYFTGTVWIGTLNPKVSKGDYRSYVDTARQVNDPKGVAAFFWASLEIENMSLR